MTNAREWASICSILLLLAWLELDVKLKAVPTQPDIPWCDMPYCERHDNDRDPRRFLDESHNWRFSRVLAANERILFTGTVVIISHRVESSKAKMEVNEMDDFTLIKEIFRRCDMSEVRKSRWVYEMGSDTRYLFTDVTPIEALRKMIYALNIDHKCEPVINKTESGLHLWFEDRGITYAVALK